MVNKLYLDGKAIKKPPIRDNAIQQVNVVITDVEKNLFFSKKFIKKSYLKLLLYISLNKCVIRQ